MVQNKIKYKYFMTGKPVSMCHAADVIPKHVESCGIPIYFSVLRAFSDCSDALDNLVLA